MDSGNDRSRALRNFERMDSDSRKAGQQLDGLAAGKVTRRQDLGAAWVRLEVPGFQLAPVARCKSGPATQGRFVHAGRPNQNGKSSSVSSSAPGKSSKLVPPEFAVPVLAPAAAGARLLPPLSLSKSPDAPRPPPSMISSRTLISVLYRVCLFLSCHCRYSM